MALGEENPTSVPCSLFQWHRYQFPMLACYFPEISRSIPFLAPLNCRAIVHFLFLSFFPSFFPCYCLLLPFRSLDENPRSTNCTFCSNFCPFSLSIPPVPVTRLNVEILHTYPTGIIEQTIWSKPTKFRGGGEIAGNSLSLDLPRIWMVDGLLESGPPLFLSLSRRFYGDFVLILDGE